MFTPGFITPDAASRLNAMEAVLDRILNSTQHAPPLLNMGDGALGIDLTPGQIALGLVIPAKITGQSGPSYSWIEQEFQAPGGWINKPAGRTGTAYNGMPGAQYPAYEYNGNLSVPTGSIVGLIPGAYYADERIQDFLFYSCCGGSADPVRVIVPTSPDPPTLPPSIMPPGPPEGWTYIQINVNPTKNIWWTYIGGGVWNGYCPCETILKTSGSGSGSGGGGGTVYTLCYPVPVKTTLYGTYTAKTGSLTCLADSIVMTYNPATLQWEDWTRICPGTPCDSGAGLLGFLMRCSATVWSLSGDVYVCPAPSFVSTPPAPFQLVFDITVNSGGCIGTVTLTITDM